MQSEVVFSRSVAGAVFIYSHATEHKNNEECAKYGNPVIYAIK